MTHSRCFRSRRPSLWITFLSCATFLLATAGYADGLAPAHCFMTGLPQSGLGPTPDPILRVRADLEDLLVDVQWANDDRPTARFVLTTPDELEVATWDLARTPGQQTEERLAGALTSVASHGFQYRLRLEDPEIAQAPVHLRVTVDCPTSEPCVYRVVQGLNAGAVAVSTSLWEALAEAREQGANDLIAKVRATRPDLANELPGLLWQLRLADPTPVKPCRCTWFTVYDFAPLSGTWLGPLASSPPRHTFGQNPPGAGFAAGVQAVLGMETVSATQTVGHTIIGPQLLCTRQTISETRGYPTSWPSMPYLEVPERVVASCPAPCTPTIEFGAMLRGCAQASATSRQGLAVVADATISVDLFFNGMSRVNGVAQSRIDAGAGEAGRDWSTIDEFTVATANDLGALARLDAEGTLEATIVGNNGYPYSYAFAAASAEYSLNFLATSTCAEVPHYATEFAWYLNGGNQGGGVAMETWESP